MDEAENSEQTPKRRGAPRGSLAVRATERKKALLDAYRECASVKYAAKAVGVDRLKHYRWLKEDEDYAKAFAAAQADAGQAVEDEAVRRAMQGVSTPRLWQGRVVRHRGKVMMETEYSDQLLIALLKRFRPELYRERTTTEITGNISLGQEIIEAKARLRLAKEEQQKLNGHDLSASGAVPNGSNGAA